MRQTKVEWPFVKLLGRKREIGCNPCAANRKCRTKYIRPFLILFRTYIRVSLSPLFLLLLSFPPFKFPRHPAFFPLSLPFLCSSEIIATPPIVSWWYGGLAQAQTRYLFCYSKSIMVKGCLRYSWYSRFRFAFVNVTLTDT